jgi:hypothetical protein
MRISFDLLKAIYDSVGINELEIEPYNNNYNFMLRFNYWQQIDVSKIERVLPDYISVTEEDYYDDNCGTQYFYIIKHKGYNG